MQVEIHASLGAPKTAFGGKAVTKTDKGFAFKAPSQLTEAGFPGSEAQFAAPSVVAPADMVAKYGDAVAVGLTSAKRNHVIFAYGQRYSDKRAQMFGAGAGSAASKGFAHAVLSKIAAAAGSAPSGVTYTTVCYGVGAGEALVDFIDSSNADAVILETAHESPKPTKLEAVAIRSAADANKVAEAVAANVTSHFSTVEAPPATPEEQAMPPYVGTTVVLAVYRHVDGDRFGEAPEVNSVQLIALGDCDRPTLLGVDPQQQQSYDETQRHLGAVCGIVTAINCNRLRVPYGKTKFTSMLKRAYNAEKNAPEAAAENQPTLTVFWAHVLEDDGSAEEAYHALCTLRKCLSLVGGLSVGNVTRDLAAEKWRVEQDIVELKDELAIAKAVHDYKPCIYDQAKPVANVGEEVRKRVEAIKKKRQEARLKAEQEVEKRAAEEAEKYIAQLEKESGKTMAGLEQQLKSLQDEKTTLEVERNKRREEHERHLAKVHKKREAEEELAEKLRGEVEALEAELAAKRDLVSKKRGQLDAASEDQAKGRAAVLKEREEIRQTRQRLYQQRREERQRWLKQIEDSNQKLLDQVASLSAARREAEAQGVPPPTEQEDTEEAVKADIASIAEYLPKLISLEDKPADPEAIEGIRRQLEEYFETEKADYAAKLEDEKKRLAELQAHVESYKTKLEEHHTKQKREMLNEAMKKENHLQSLVDQVVQYLQHGLRMYKVSSTGNVRYRFFFLTEDCKAICACELDDNGMAINRRKPTATIILHDVVRVTLGTYTSSFVGFAGEAQLAQAREKAMREDGNGSPELTQAITPQQLGRFNYRAFTLELKSGKTLEVVCETDSDWEAWVVAMKRLFNFRTDYERRTMRAPREETALIRWGRPLDVARRPEASQLQQYEQDFCGEYHIPPRLYLNTKSSVTTKSQSAYVTVYDVRVASKLDLLRAQQLYEFFVDQRVLPPPRR